MKLEDVVAVNLVDRHPQSPVRPSRELAALSPFVYSASLILSQHGYRLCLWLCWRLYSWAKSARLLSNCQGRSRNVIKRRNKNV
ncbi:hypothetical protein [Liquorilactobacillus vini]|uniref:hypothetical protein n=1 Tax=Liquorilactobacillus vini TaxID=238015 RepID=UPI0005587B15|nr:hypothetical protein [Liquorilactobacillus vini]